MGIANVRHGHFLINSVLYTLPRWAQLLVALVGTIVVLGLAFLIMLSGLDEKQRQFDHIYYNVFQSGSGSYERHHADVRGLANDDTIQKSAGSPVGISTRLFDVIQGLDLAYAQIEGCLSTKDCEPGWKTFLLCRNANRDWDYFRQIQHKITDSGLNIDLGRDVVRNEKTVVLFVPGNLADILFDICQ